MQDIQLYDQNEAYTLLVIFANSLWIELKKELKPLLHWGESVGLISS